MKKILNVKLVIMSELKNTKMFCERIYSKLVRKIFIISKIKNAVPWIYVISDLKGKPIAGSF